MKLTKKVKAVIEKVLDEEAIIKINKADIDSVLKRRKEATLIPKKGIWAKGALVYIEGTRKLSLDDIEEIGDNILTNCREKANVVWGAVVKKNLKKIRTTAIYVY